MPCPDHDFAALPLACGDSPAGDESSESSGASESTDDDTAGSEASATSADSGDASTGESSEGSGDESSDDSTTAGVDDCHFEVELHSAVEALGDPEHGCFGWLDRTHGRMTRTGVASGVVWTRRTEHRTGVMVSAAHVQLGFGDPTEDVPALLVDPSQQVGMIGTTLVEQGGTPRELYSGAFLFYHPSIPEAEAGNNLVDIRPRHDFFMSAIDSQELSMGNPAPIPDPLVEALLELYDPLDITLEGPTHADPEPGDELLLLGFPADGGALTGTLAYSVARVLDDAEAESAIEELAAVGDEEGSIPYDPEAEIIVEGAAVSGMSGGGAFDRDGRHIGVLVRASTTTELDTRYVRITRTTFILDQMQATYDALPVAQRDAIAPYIEPFR